MKVCVASNGHSATVTIGEHTTQIVGLDYARRWVEFYERMVARYGLPCEGSLALFARVEAEMISAAGTAA